jgi:hypothetical protein
MYNKKKEKQGWLKIIGKVKTDTDLFYQKNFFEFNNKGAYHD